MFVIILNYRKSIAEVDLFAAEHRAFLQQHYATGNFLLSGRREPRTGGVILATAGTKAEVEAIVNEDPFHREAIADYDIIEFLPSMAADQLAHLKVP